MALVVLSEHKFKLLIPAFLPPLSPAQLLNGREMYIHRCTMRHYMSQNLAGNIWLL